MEFDGELLCYTVSLTNSHLCQAIDTYLSSEEHKNSSTTKYNWITSKNSALSSIIHSFCALESAINEVGHMMFHDSKSPIYFLDQGRNYTLRKAIQSWKNVDCIEKFHIIIDCAPKGKHVEKLVNRMREFNGLRNWLVHGFVFEASILLENKPEEGVYEQVDREDNVNWISKFPNTKFGSIDQLSSTDARTSLLITLDAMRILYGIINKPLILHSYYHGSHVSLIHDNSVTAETYLDLHIKGLRT
jgi:hypothetical protein